MEDLKRQLSDHEHRIHRLEVQCEAQHEGLGALRDLVTGLGARVTVVRDMLAEHERRILTTLAEHERRDLEKRTEDRRYRSARERIERRVRITNGLSLLGVLATLAAVLLSWWLTAP